MRRRRELVIGLVVVVAILLVYRLTIAPDSAISHEPVVDVQDGGADIVRIDAPDPTTRRSLLGRWRPDASTDSASAEPDDRPAESTAPTSPSADQPRTSKGRTNDSVDARGGADDEFGVPYVAFGPIFGHVRYEGPKPKAVALDMSKDPKCNRIAKDRERYDVIVDDTGGLKDVLVRVMNPPFGGPISNEVHLAHEACRFAPPFIVPVVGQTLVYTNRDALLHNLHVNGRGLDFNVSAPKQDMVIRRTISKPLMLTEITCDVHPWEQAWLVTSSHPYFAVTDEHGDFTIPNIPIGESYEVEVWHRTAGSIKVRAAGANTRLDVALRPAGPK